MGNRLRLENTGDQAAARTPAPGTEVKIAIDLSRTKWGYCVRWEGQEQRRLTTPGELKHVQALVAQYQGCPVHLAFEACGFGHEIAWWAQGQCTGRSYSRSYRTSIFGLPESRGNSQMDIRSVSTTRTPLLHSYASSQHGCPLPSLPFCFDPNCTTDDCLPQLRLNSSTSDNAG